MIIRNYRIMMSPVDVSPFSIVVVSPQDVLSGIINSD